MYHGTPLQISGPCSLGWWPVVARARDCVLSHFVSARTHACCAPLWRGWCFGGVDGPRYCGIPFVGIRVRQSVPLGALSLSAPPSPLLTLRCPLVGSRTACFSRCPFERDVVWWTHVGGRVMWFIANLQFTNSIRLQGSIVRLFTMIPSFLRGRDCLSVWWMGYYRYVVVNVFTIQSNSIQFNSIHFNLI